MRQMLMILRVTLVVSVCTVEAVSKTDFVEMLLVEDHLICRHQSVVLDIDGTKQIHAFKFAAKTNGFSEISVRRAEMNDLACETEGSNKFGKAVDFCCNDAGSEVLIELQAFNSKGELRNCMVDIKVIEGGSLTVNGCLPDLVVPCNTPIDPANLSNLGRLVTDASLQQPIIIHGDVVGFDGIIQSKCGDGQPLAKKITVNEIVDIEETQFCGQAFSITRRFQITDAGGVNSECQQHILVEADVTPLLYQDIIWPADTTVFGCSIDEFDRSALGVPTFPTADCENLIASHEDTEFNVTDASCRKFLRTWTVIDWCAFAANQNSGIWEHTQVVRIESNIKPVITNCEDIETCVNEKTCLAKFVFNLVATDDCANTEDLFYTYALSLNGDDDNRLIGNSRTVNEYLPIGQHVLFWSVRDGCNNFETCSHQITVKDCTSPSLICLGSFTSTLTDLGINEDPVLEVWVNDLVKGPFDNCTPVDSAILSFSKDTLIQFMNFGCADIGINELEIVVKGNDTHSSCITSLVVQDNANLCGLGRSATILEGSITSESGSPISDVEIGLSSIHATTTVSSNVEGKYLFENIEEGEEYTLSLSKQDQSMEGISVRDLVLLQNHIIGKQELESAYQVIAGDLDLSGHLSVTDLVRLKAYVLGKVENDISWTFVNTDITFIDPMSPWPFQSDLNLAIENGTENVNFIGLKMGDIDHSSMDDMTESRSSKSIVIPYEITKKGIELDLSAVDFEMIKIDLTSLKFLEFLYNKIALSTNDLSSIVNENVNQYSLLLDHTNIDKSTLLIKGQKDVENMTAVVVTNDLLETDAYFTLKSPKKSVHITPNPFQDFVSIQIESDHVTDIEIRLLDMSGRLVQNFQHTITRGVQNLNMPINNRVDNGMYFLLIEGPDFEPTTKKIIKTR